jgi:radical SAM superfamily enzyme YgiQ (UPF0313 family)
MKILIVSLASQYIHSALAPWYLYYSAKKHINNTATVEVFEGTVNEDANNLFEKIRSKEADIIAFSCYIWNIEMVKILAQKLKIAGAEILLGGPEVSYNTKELLKEKYVDYVISGEGEKPFIDFINGVCSKADLTNISGLCFKQGEKIHINPPHCTETIPESPYGEEYLSTLNGRIAYIETSRGCPFSCAFCLSGRLGGVRFFPIERAKNDILTLANSGSKIIKFVDRTFNANKKRAYELWQFIIENYGTKIPKDVCFHFEIAGDLLSDEDFALLEKSPKGFIQFEIGIQSFNAKTLSAINRKTNTNLLKNNIQRLCNMKNIHIHIDLIAGLPFEDYKTFRDGFNLAFSLGADMLQLGFLKLLHGADMREKSLEYPCEFSSLPPYEVKSTPYVSERDLKLLHFTENALDRFVGSGRFPRTNALIFGKQKRNPFDTLTELGMFTGGESRPLNEYVNMLYSFFGADSKALRDALISDIATSVKGSVLPSSLIIPDKNLKLFKKSLEENPETRRKKGVMRNVFLLYGEKCGAYVDYDEQIDGKYILKRLPFEFER